MGYNRENFNRIKQEYEDKYIRARELADLRRVKIHNEIPEIAEIDRILERTGARIMGIVCSGASDANEQIAKLRTDNQGLIETRKTLLELKGYPANFTDVKYECEKCGDSGYVGTKMCDCMRQKLIFAGYESSGMSRLMKDQTFDNFSLDYYKQNSENYKKMTEVYNTMKEFADSFTVGNGDNLALFGSTGLGKTHLSSAVARRIIERGFDVSYVTAQGLISDFERERFGNSGYGAGEGNTERYFEADLLIIDDLGTEMTNQFTVACLYNVINTRINLKKSTIISANVNAGELRQRYTDRIASRLLGEYRVLPFSGKDVRAQKLNRKNK